MQKLKYTNPNFVELNDWNSLITSVYGRPYDLQQQEDCMERGNIRISIPDEDTEDEEMYESIPEVVNGDEIGVKFNVWLERDPNKKLPSPCNDDFSLELFWHRSFYPNLQTVANDLHARGHIDAGDYIINIDW